MSESFLEELNLDLKSNVLIREISTSSFITAGDTFIG